MGLKCDCFTDELVVGHVGEWDLSSGDLIEHKVNDCEVLDMAINGDRIVTSDSSYHPIIRVFNVTTCLLFSINVYIHDEL